jgi:hypothetical protein
MKTYRVYLTNYKLTRSLALPYIEVTAEDYLVSEGALVFYVEKGISITRKDVARFANGEWAFFQLVESPAKKSAGPGRNISEEELAKAGGSLTGWRRTEPLIVDQLSDAFIKRAERTGYSEPCNCRVIPHVCGDDSK